MMNQKRSDLGTRIDSISSGAALVQGKRVYSLALRDYDSAWSLSGHKPYMPGTILTIEQTRARRAEKLAELAAA